MAGNPVQRGLRDVETDLAGLDLHRPGIDLLGETTWSQHWTPPVRACPEVWRPGGRKPTVSRPGSG